MAKLTFKNEDKLEPTQGVYGKLPTMLNRYSSNHGRDVLDNMTVARIYLTGLEQGGTKGSVLGFSGNTANYTLFSDGNYGSRSYVGFILESVTERNEEKTQIAALNGDRFAAYYLGASPVAYVFRGRLLNTIHDDWRTIFTELYGNVFRGSVVSSSRRMVQIAYDKKIVTGAMSGFEQVLQSDNEQSSQFSFSLLVYHVLNTEEPSQERYTSTFLGDTRDFDRVSVQTPTEEPDTIVTAFVTPPPKPRKPRKSKRRSARCAPIVQTNSSGTQTKGGIDSVEAAALAKCTAGIENAKQAQLEYNSTKNNNLKAAINTLATNKGWSIHPASASKKTTKQ